MPFEGSKLDYTAAVDARCLKDEAKLSVSGDGVAVTTLFNPVFIDFADIVAFERQGYTIVVATADDRFTFNRLGNLTDAFWLELYGAFNAKVRKALFVEGAPAFAAEGEFRFTEPAFPAEMPAGTQATAVQAPPVAQGLAAQATASQAIASQGRAQIEVYDDCVCLLPPDNRARRIPLAFMTELQKGNFELTLSLDGGEQYSFIRLGNNTDAFEACIREKLHMLRENALDAVRQLDGSLSQQQLSAIAALMPEGVAAPLGRLAAIAPSYVAALEAKIAASRAADTYGTLKEICDPAQICVGMKMGLGGGQNAAAGQSAGGQTAAEKPAGEQSTGAEPSEQTAGAGAPPSAVVCDGKPGGNANVQDPDFLWFIAPSGTKPTAAVEWAVDEDTAAATYIYHTGGDGAAFLRSFNCAMAAVNFHRDVIRLPDEQLLQAENRHLHMAVKRSAALQALRANMAGRVIHSSLPAWINGMRQYLC